MIALDLPDVGPLDCATHIHVAAHHWQSDQFKSFTPGVGVLCRRAHNAAHLGGVSLVRNSHNRPALYAFVGYQPLRAGNVRVGAIAGLRTRAVFRRYDNIHWQWDPQSFDHTDVVPFGAAVASWQWRPGAEVHLVVIPPIKLWTPATAALSISWGWK